MSEYVFDHVNLATVDPNQTPVALDTYTFQILKSEKKEYAVKDKETKQPTGETGNYFNMTVAIVDSPKFSGRRFYLTFFPNAGSLKQLRRLSDKIGVPQSGDFDSWMTQEIVNCRFKAPVQENPKDLDQATGKPKVGPNMWEVQTA